MCVLLPIQCLWEQEVLAQTLSMLMLMELVSLSSHSNEVITTNNITERGQERQEEREARREREDERERAARERAAGDEIEKEAREREARERGR